MIIGYCFLKLTQNTVTSEQVGPSPKARSVKDGNAYYCSLKVFNSVLKGNDSSHKIIYKNNLGRVGPIR